MSIQINETDSQEMISHIVFCSSKEIHIGVKEVFFEQWVEDILRYARLLLIERPESKPPITFDFCSPEENILKFQGNIHQVLNELFIPFGLISKKMESDCFSTLRQLSPREHTHVSDTNINFWEAVGSPSPSPTLSPNLREVPVTV